MEVTHLSASGAAAKLSEEMPKVVPVLLRQRICKCSSMLQQNAALCQLPCWCYCQAAAFKQTIRCRLDSSLQGTTRGRNGE